MLNTYESIFDNEEEEVKLSEVEIKVENELNRYCKKYGLRRVFFDMYIPTYDEYYWCLTKPDPKLYLYAEVYREHLKEYKDRVKREKIENLELEKQYEKSKDNDMASINYFDD